MVTRLIQTAVMSMRCCGTLHVENLTPPPLVDALYDDHRMGMLGGEATGIRPHADPKIQGLKVSMLITASLTDLAAPPRLR